MLQPLCRLKRRSQRDPPNSPRLWTRDLKAGLVWKLPFQLRLEQETFHDMSIKQDAMARPRKSEEKNAPIHLGVWSKRLKWGSTIVPRGSSPRVGSTPL
jgi:hypothetical protein